MELVVGGIYMSHGQNVVYAFHCNPSHDFSILPLGIQIYVDGFSDNPLCNIIGRGKCSVKKSLCLMAMPTHLARASIVWIKKKHSSDVTT